GDLEVMKALNIRCYAGIDASAVALAIARQARPDWVFLSQLDANVPSAEFVLCLEVLIHQNSEAAYRSLIRFLAEKTLRVLLVSGYDQETPAIRANPMLSFVEPLRLSLERTGRFSRIQAVGRHSDVIIYRCDV